MLEIRSHEAFLNLNLVNIQAAKETLNSLFFSNWSQEILYKPKLRTFVLIKHSYGEEKYVRTPLSKQQRSLCAQLRAGILPLHLETGRYRGTPEEERVCVYCNMDIENEFHFLFYCPLYHELRSRLFDKCENLDLLWLNDADRLKWLFDHKVFAFAEFLEKAWRKRMNETFT